MFETLKQWFKTIYTVASHRAAVDARVAAIEAWAQARIVAAQLDAAEEIAAVRAEADARTATLKDLVTAVRTETAREIAGLQKALTAEQAHSDRMANHLAVTKRDAPGARSVRPTRGF